MISISVSQLTKRFGPTLALDALDLEIAAGELFFLLGPSGCGKTTLLRTLAGFYFPDEGAIRFGTEDVTRLEPHRRNTGMMFQSYALWPHLTVAENVVFGLQERKVPRAESDRRVAEALDAVQMGAYATRKPNQLSGGQQQRVALARALVVRPRCLLLDEPLSNLDAKLRLEMRAEIRRVCKEYGLTAVYVTHDQKEALSVADRLAVLDGGRLLQVGSPREVYRRPRSRAVAGFIGEADFIPGRMLERRGREAEVETALGRFVGVFGDESAAPAPGAELTLSIRPECWSLRDRPEPRNSVSGRIGHSTYLGEIAQHSFLPAGGDHPPLKIFELNPGPPAASSAGPLHAVVAGEDVVVLGR